jgi:hypothetical protein
MLRLVGDEVQSGQFFEGSEWAVRPPEASPMFTGAPNKVRGSSA